MVEPGQPEPQRPLTPEEAEALVRFVSDPEYRERITRVLQATYLNAEWWREMTDVIARTYLDPEKWQRVGQALQTTYLNPEFWQRMRDVLAQTYFNADNWKRVGEVVAAALSAEGYRALGTAVADAVGRHDADLSDVAREFDTSVGESLSEVPQPDGEAPLWWWLSTRDALHQATLLVAALTLLDKLARAAGDSVLPDELKHATDVLLAVATFLVVWFQYQTRPPGL